MSQLAEKGRLRRAPKHCARALEDRGYLHNISCHLRILFYWHFIISKETECICLTRRHRVKKIMDLLVVDFHVGDFHFGLDIGIDLADALEEGVAQPRDYSGLAA